MRWLFLLLTFGSLTFGAQVSCDPKYHYEPKRFRRQADVLSAQLSVVAGLLVDWREAHGRFPTNAEGLTVLDQGTEDMTDLTDPADPMQEYRLWRIWEGHAFGDEPLHRFQAGVYSAWRVPFGYENRNGLDPCAFAASPANDDPDGQWSVVVAPGIHVWCVGARANARESEVLFREAVLWKSLGFILPAIFALLFIWSLARTKRTNGSWKAWNSLKYVGAGLFFVFWGFIAMPPMVTCYVMRYFTPRKRGERAEEYRETLRSFRDGGVLDEATCSKFFAALDRDERLMEPPAHR